MTPHLKVLVVDVSTGMYRLERYPVGPFFGPVDVGLKMAAERDALTFGTGLFAGSILPGSNRLVFTGFSPCWRSFFISSMGGAGLVFDDLGLNAVALVGRAPAPAVVRLNREHGEEVQVHVDPVDLPSAWDAGRGGAYGLLDTVFERFGGEYAHPPRVLAVGPAAATTDLGGILSAPAKDGRPSAVDTWAGRGGLGSKLLQDHNVAAVVFGGTHVDEDFRDRKVADGWFEARYQQRLAAKDVETTIKYRFDPAFGTGGTFGVNYASMGGRLLAFNYRSIGWDEGQRRSVHKAFVVDHYLRQFNEETIQTRSSRTCGEPCAAVCKKMRGEFKKDYEPYQALGPLCGVFDQRAAERLVHRADALGFDAISIGGVLAWWMEGLVDGWLEQDELGEPGRPVFTPDAFAVETDSSHNADIALAMMERTARGDRLLDLSDGARELARRLAAERGPRARDAFLYSANAWRGWMVPNQYWTPGVLAPVPIGGQYYMDYGPGFLPPAELGRRCAERLQRELMLDQLGTCRFHRGWAEEMLPEVVEELLGCRDQLLRQNRLLAVRIASRNNAAPWESARCAELVQGFLARRFDVEGDRSPELVAWLDRFHADRDEAARTYWFETSRGLRESLLGV